MDENVDTAYSKQLKNQLPEITILKVGDLDAPDRGTLDPDILIWCEAKSFILITNNRASMPGHLKDHLAQNRHIPGIITLGSRLTMGENLAELLLIAQVSFEDDYKDQIINLPLTF
ncbi:MAG: hypothetical protein AAF152_05190 [Cyanobacteria bacterium P01_A01_bin.114]